MKTQNQFEVLRREKKPKLVEQEVADLNEEPIEQITTAAAPLSLVNGDEIFKITPKSKDINLVEIFKTCEFEIEGNLKIYVQMGEIQVAGKIFKKEDTLTVYSSINHVAFSAKSECSLLVEKFGFDFNLKILKELDNEFRLIPSRDLLGTKISATAMTSVIIGPVNSGKSTAARYLTNMLLNNHDTVAFLDCDLGQPEFTPPGMISLTMVKDPLLGPPCTHFKISKHSIFIGDTTAKRDPDAYITGLYKLVDIYRNDCNGIPLVVNTSGWVRGVGFDLLKHFITYLNPESMIFMENSKSFRPQELIEPSKLSNSSIMRLPAPETLTNLKLNSADHRTISLSFYFYKLLTNPLVSLFSQPAYRIAFGDIKIKFLEAQVPYSQSLYALNGSIVALIIDSTSYHSKVQSLDLNFVPTHTHLDQQCVGLGLIKSISKSNKCFYIITPVDSDVLEKVNLIVKGSLEMTGLVGEKGVLPYTAVGSGEGLGSVEVKTRHLGRKRALNST